MISISQLTQSRLSVLLFDKTTNAFLTQIPVYAEMSVTVELPPYPINHQLEFTESENPLRVWLAAHSFVFNSINNVITSNVAENDFTDILDKHRLYITLLEEIKANLVDSDTDENKKLLITKIVLKVLQKLKIKTETQPNRKSLVSFPLGTLASDHAGYLSYDLTNVVGRFENMVKDAQLLNSEVAFFVYPLGRDDLKINVLQQSTFTPDVIFGRLQIDLPRELDDVKKANLPSMHNPGLEDWYLSPGSFALNPDFFIGADGCENLYPANFATHEFSFGSGKIKLIDVLNYSDRKRA